MRTLLSVLTTRLLLLLVPAAMVACATSPTGRNQLTLFSSQEIAQMGNQSYQAMLEEAETIESGELYDFVQCVARPLLREAEGDWRLTLFDDNQVNAFALPGNNIGIYKGLLGVAENQHQLAAVVGHEIAHVEANHGNERVSTAMATQVGLELTASAIGSSPGGDYLMAALGLGTQVGITLPFSRAQESEADVLGLRMMADAGFDPRQSIDLWRNMNAASQGDRPPEFLSTHPGPETRMRTLNQHLDDALRRRDNANRAGKRPDCMLSDAARAGLE